MGTYGETVKALGFVAEAASNVEVARGLVNDAGQTLREVVTVRVLDDGTTEARYPLGFFAQWTDVLAN